MNIDFESRWRLEQLGKVWKSRRWTQARERCNRARVRAGLALMLSTDQPLDCWINI